MTQNLTLNAQLSIKIVHDQLMNTIVQEKRETRKKSNKVVEFPMPHAGRNSRKTLRYTNTNGLAVAFAGHTQSQPGPTTSKGTVGDANARPNNGRNQLQCCGLYN